MIALLAGQFVMGAVVLRHYRDTGFGRAAERMIVTRCVDRSYREVEGANAGNDSYKTAHVGLILSVRFSNAADVTLSHVASSSPMTRTSP
jgi:hypothetical protein